MMWELPPKGRLRQRYFGIRRKLLALREKSVGERGNVSEVIGGRLVVAHWERGWTLTPGQGPEGDWETCCRDFAVELLEQEAG